MPSRNRKSVELHSMLKRQIERYNRRIKVIKSKYPELKELYSENLKISELKKVVKGKRDLNKLTKSIDKLFDNEYIKPKKLNDELTLNKHAIDEYNKNVKIVNKQKEKEFNLLVQMPYKGTPYSYVQMGGMVESDLKPITRKPKDYINTKSFAKATKSIRYRSFSGYLDERNQQYKENFIKSLRDLGNEMYDDNGNIVEINMKSIVRKIPADTFVVFLQNNGENLHHVLNDNYTVPQKRERMTELFNLLNVII